MAHSGRQTKTMTYLWMSATGDDSAPLCRALMGLSVMTNIALSACLISLFATSKLRNKHTWSVQGVQERIWRVGFTVLPTPYPAWAAAHRSTSCKVLSGLCEHPALPVSLLCLSRRNLLPSGCTVGPWLPAEKPPTHMTQMRHSKSSERYVFVWERAFEGWAPALPAGCHICSPKGGQCLSDQLLVCFALTGVYEKPSFRTLVRLFLASHEPTSHSFGCISLTRTTVAASRQI